VEFVDSLAELETSTKKRLLEKSLIICDLGEILSNPQEQKMLVELRWSRETKILGKYPHVLKGLRERAVASGIDYVVPNSNFTQKLEELLTGG